MKKYFQTMLALGLKPEHSNYVTRQIKVFNVFNLIGALASLVRFTYVLCSPVGYSNLTIALNFLPFIVCLTMGICMYANRVIVAAVISFLLFPPVFVLIYTVTLDASAASYLVLYFLFPFFFLHKTSQIVASFIWAALCFFFVQIALQSGLTIYPASFYKFDLGLAYINFSLAIALIFACLHSIRTMILAYQGSLRSKKQELKQLNELKDKMFSIISHDLRSPMAATSQLLDLVKTANLSKEEVDFYLGELKTSVENTRAMMENLLAWSKSQIASDHVQIETVNVRSLVEDSMKYLRSAAENKSITLTNHVGFSYGVQADRQMLNIILRNLISNAIKFTGDNGTVSVGISQTLDGKLSVQVQDNGVGIPASKQHLILANEYYTTSGTSNENGSGIGLKICQELTIQNKGTLSFESMPGSGTTFSLTLPKGPSSQAVAAYNGQLKNLRYA